MHNLQIQERGLVMFYENELRFLCEILKKCRLSVSFISPEDTLIKVLDDNFTSLFLNDSNKNEKISSLLGDIKPYNIYKFTNPFKLYYLILALPQTSVTTYMMMGPYLNDKLDTRQVMEISETNAIAPSKQKLLKDYYNTIPVLLETDRIFTIIDTFAERIWGGVGSYSIIDTTNEGILSTPVLSKPNNENNQDILINMKLMEQRYAYEKEIMLAVSSGNDHKVAHIMSTLSTYTFDSRIPDAVRNLKNYSVVMNTLLRKAAEEGGVHPIYIDDLSSKFAVRIEQLNSIDAVHDLMSEMLKSYCRLVRKHSTKHYSSTVQKTIALIEYDITSNLTLSSLASLQNISPGYLSTIFKKETGKTITEFIVEKRVEHAKRLLTTTRLQVQTVALHCGIMDVQYFSKIFKKKTGKTPKEYRELSNMK